MGIEYLILGIGQSSLGYWTPMQQAQGTNYTARRHQEGLSLFPHHLEYPVSIPGCTSATAGHRIMVFLTRKVLFSLIPVLVYFLLS